jgi:hypothetical protein
MKLMILWSFGKGACVEFALAHQTLLLLLTKSRSFCLVSITLPID